MYVISVNINMESVTVAIRETGKVSRSKGGSLFAIWENFTLYIAIKNTKNTKVLNVSLTDNTCYVNLDSGFISGDTDVAEYIPIYAIVDSLTELQTVNKVQITVNGSADVTYRNVISLAQPLEREEKYIVK